MRLYRASALVISLAAVTAITALVSPSAGSDSASRTVLLNISSSPSAQEAAKPIHPAPKNAPMGKVASVGEMMRAMSGIQPLNEGVLARAQGEIAHGTPSPEEGGTDQVDGAHDVEGAGEAAVPMSTTESAGNQPGGTEGAPLDDRRLAPILAAYHSQLVQLIEGQKLYPQIARKLGHQGIVQLKFTLSQDGRLVSSQISSNSGFPELDDSAMQALRAVPKFPAFPTDLGPANRSFQVSLSYTLN